MKIRITTSKAGDRYPEGSIQDLADNIAGLLVRHGDAVEIVEDVAPIVEEVPIVVEVPVVVEESVVKHETVAEYMASRVERSKTCAPDSIEETLAMED